MDGPDYHGTLGFTVRMEHGVSCVLGTGERIRFLDIDPDELCIKINDAAHLAMAHFKGIAARAGVAFTSPQIEQVAMRVTIDALYL